MLNKVRIMIGMMMIAGMLVWFVGGQIAAGSTTPGTVNDPLVTKSYVDLKVAEVKAELLAMFGNTDVEPGAPPTDLDDDAEQLGPEPDDSITMDDVKAYVNAQLIINDATSDDHDTSEASVEEAIELFVVVEATNNQRLLCGASAEVILRAGSATVIAGSEGDGLANLTTGEDLRAGSDVPLQNHLLVSRDDGRGLLITSDDPENDVDAYILVKGDYRLE